MQGVRFRAQLSIIEERLLFCQFKRGERASRTRTPADVLRQSRDAGNRLVALHLPLVHEMADKLFLKNRVFLVDVEDLVSSGEEGLVIALRRFRGARNEGKRTRFATYAAWWIKAAVASTIRDQRWMVGIPSQIYRHVLRLLKASYELQRTSDHVPTIGEMATRMGMRTEAMARLMAWVSPQCLSLETPVGEDGEATIADFLEDRSISPPNMSAELTLLHEGFGRILGTLPTRQRLIIEGRFGLDGQGQRTQREIGNQLNLSPQSVGALEQSALRLMRSAFGVKTKLSRKRRRSRLRRSATRAAVNGAPLRGADHDGR